MKRLAIHLAMASGAAFPALRSLAALIFTAMLFAGQVDAGTTFSFTLDEPCKTSAGVYQTNGTLVRTLWSKVRYYAPGTYTTIWNGLDDNGNAVAAGRLPN